MKRLLFLTLILACSSSQAQSLYDKALTFQFDAQGKSQIKELDVTNQWHLLPGHPWEPKQFAYGVQSGTMPAGKTTHAMSFWFRSNGFFSDHPEDSDHIALMIKGEWRNGFLRGRGMILSGDSISVPYGLDPSSTFETYDTSWLGHGGNVWFDRYQGGLRDNTWYQVTLTANSSGETYEIRNQAGALVTHDTLVDTISPSQPANLGGWFIVATNSNNTTNWTISFTDVQVWWF